MIKVDQVTKFYGNHAAVRDLCFEIESGECVGFLGLNGAGKTTTLRLLSCLVLPTSGRVSIGGLDAEAQPYEIRKLIGFLPDTPPLYGEMRVTDYLRFAGQLRGMKRRAVADRMGGLLDECGLGPVAEQPIATLSHGYRQRVGIAQAVIHSPRLLILDEPIQGLDPVQIMEMRSMIRRLRGRHTILVSSHILTEIEQTCDRILMLHQGRIAAQGSEQELAAQLGGHLSVQIDLHAPEETNHDSLSQRVKELLQTAEGVLSVSCSANPDQPGQIQVSLRLSSDTRAAVARTLIENGLDLLQLQRRTTDLESMFIKLSGADNDPGARGQQPKAHT